MLLRSQTLVSTHEVVDRRVELDLLGRVIRSDGVHVLSRAVDNVVGRVWPGVLVGLRLYW